MSDDLPSQWKEVATKADVVEALLVTQQIASSLADALLASENSDREGVIRAMREYLEQMQRARALGNQLVGIAE